MLEKFLTPRQIAESLNVTPRTIHQQLKSGELVGFRINRSWRIPESAYLQWVKSLEGKGKPE